MRKKHLLILLTLTSTIAFAQDSLFRKIHFLYGSKPSTLYKDSEEKWFGGVLGGHVGVEVNNNQILNFIPHGSFHIYSKKENKHSAFSIHSFQQFYSIFGGNADSMKKAIF